MAHSNRNKQREKRKAQKAARKAARRAEWAALAGTSKNKKKKGQGGKGIQLVKPSRILMEVPVDVNGVRVMAPRKVHGGPECRNIGCKRCSPVWRSV